MEDGQMIWNQVRTKLQNSYSPETFDQTFKDVKYVKKVDNNTIYVLTPSLYINQKINKLYYKSINQIVGELTHNKYIVKFINEGDLSITTNPLNNYSKLSMSNLKANYNFDSFVVGESNKFAYNTAKKVAKTPGTFVNPLYIFGGVGLGKTHLMQAIGNYILNANPDTKLVYVQANDYLSDYTKASRDNNMKAFEEKYENIDVFLIDDIQMLTSKTGTQQQFFKLFNDMSNHEKQIVITSDCPATKLNGFMDRLTSRFQMGVTVNINQPDLPQRISILKRKLSEASDIKLNDEILEFLASSFTDNVRELEGALNRLLLYIDLSNEKPTLALAKEALRDLIDAVKPQNNNENYEDALSVIANMYNITISDLISSDKKSKYVLPRHIAMYILKNKYNFTYAKIGSILNGRDHTTIMNGCKKISNDLENNEELKTAIESILKKL